MHCTVGSDDALRRFLSVMCSAGTLREGSETSESEDEGLVFCVLFELATGSCSVTGGIEGKLVVELGFLFGEVMFDFPDVAEDELVMDEVGVRGKGV